MTIMELKDQIMKNKLSNFYIFVGNEIGIMNIYLKQMSEKLGMPITRADNVASVYSKCTVRSLFEEPDCLYVIRGDEDIWKHEEVYSDIQNGLGKNVLVLLYDKIDTRLKFGKYFKDDIVEFQPLATNVLCAYIKKVCPLNDTNLEKLSNIVDNSYDLSMLEVDKINRYAEVNKISADESFKELLEQGVIYIPEECTVFEFVDAVMNRNSRLSLAMLNSLLKEGASSINMLGVLYTKVKQVLLVQECGNEGQKEISTITGLNEKEVYFSKKFVNRYKSYELVYALKLIKKTVSDIKDGNIDDCYATHIVLSHLL